MKPPVAPFETGDELIPRGRIDELVFESWKQPGIEPPHPCSDAVFLRRASLDATGTLPEPEEVRRFLTDADPGKRTALVDRLLETGEFVDYQSLRWADSLRVKSEFPINLWPNAVQAYSRFIRSSVDANLPYDQFARRLLTASGSNFRAGEVNFYRAMQNREPATIAQAVALTFLGMRTAPAGMAAFFSQVAFKPTTEWKEEIVYFDEFSKAPAPTVYPDGKPVRITPGQDPRAVFAAWLTAPANPWFARNVVNRVWFWLVGRGIVHEPDDFRPDNPPSIPPLLSFLGQELVAARYDPKHIYRLILNSQVYQLSSIPGASGASGAPLFAAYPLRRLDAEVLIDAVCQITGTGEDYSSVIPEPFTFLPEGQRSIALADGSITSSFLEMFGRPARSTGLAAERSNASTSEQRLHMLNSSHIQQKLQQSTRLRDLIQSGGRPRDPLDRVYLSVLSRFPTDEELRIAAAYFQSVPGNKWPAAVDLAWALINSTEFQYRH
jgi:hypothetical protein